MKNSKVSYIIFTVALIFSIPLPSKLSAQSFTKLPSTGINQSSLDTRNVLLVDLDNNSQPDIHFANINGSHEFSLNFDTTFVTPSGNGLSTMYRATGNVTSGDINKDGWPDLFFSNGTGGVTGVSLSNYLYKNDSAGIFSSLFNTSTIAANQSTCSRFVDFDGDGDLDIYVSNSGNTKSEFYRNDGNNLFVSVDTLSISNQYMASAHASWCDYDNDGDVDLFLPISNGNNKLFRNDDSTFTEITTGNIVQDGGTSFSGSWGDYNGDGYMDLFVCNSNIEANFLYKNLGNGTFQKVTSGAIVTTTGKTVSALWFDVDNDGDLDLVSAEANGQNTTLRRNKLYINNGNETFSPANGGPLTTDQSNSTGIASADIDRDGDIDLALSTRNGKNEVYFNDYSGSNGFISLNILGTNGKATALDAKVKIKCQFNGISSRWEYRHVISSKGNSAESSPITHFGTGAATIIDSLVIEWISGATCVFTNLDVNHFYNVSPSACDIDFALETKHADSTRYLTAYFTDSTVGDVISHKWNFGDGTSSVGANPIHSYATPGTYLVEHYTFDSYQKWDSAWSIISICSDSAQLGFYTSKQGTSVTFNDTSISNGYSFQWNYGDGNTGSGIVTSHQYANAGNYNVCLYVTDSCRIDTLCQTVTVCNDTLTAAFGHTSSVLNVSFTDSSVNATSIIWDFGDGTTDTSSKPNHTYTTPGYYTVCQTVMDVCTSTTTCKVIGVCLDTAVAKFSYSDTLNTITLTSNSQNANSYLWNFGDGNLSTNQNPTHTYQQYGSYTVCLIVTNDCYSDTLCQNITICAVKGVANYTYQHIGKSLTVQFQNRSTNAQSYRWDFGDGNLSTSKNPLVVYNRAWVYNVCLTVVDTCGKEDTYCQQLNMMPFSIDELTLLENIKVYPNPADDILKIELPNDMKFSTTVSLYDLNGKVLIVKTINKNQRGMNLDLSSLAKGVYMLNLDMEGASRQMKIVKN